MVNYTLSAIDTFPIQAGNVDPKCPDQSTLCKSGNKMNFSQQLLAIHSHGELLSTDLLNVSTIITTGCVNYLGWRKFVAPNIRGFIAMLFFGRIVTLFLCKVQGNEWQRLNLIVCLQGMNRYFFNIVSFNV